jgi:methionyl-tRNA formyltransferase
MSRIKKIGIIGNGRIAKECAQVLRLCEQCNLERIIIDSSCSNISADFKSYCEVQRLNHILSEDINCQSSINYLISGQLDLVFSINNHQIIRDNLLNSVPQGIINFHNSPLPRYGGLNACSWAIYNGETRHGVTWHYVSKGVDEGDIVAQRYFNIDSEITALRLIMRCINEGVDLFKDLIVDVCADAIKRTPQNKKLRLYLKSGEIPGGGLIDFSSDFATIDRLVRALNFIPLESPLGSAMAKINNQIFYVDKVRISDFSQQSNLGEIVRADDKLIVQIVNSRIEIMEVRDKDNRRVPLKFLIDNYSIKPGMNFIKGAL